MKTNNSPLITVAIVDDETLFVEGMIKVINELNTIRLTKAYYDLKSCREGLAKEMPDVLLLDIAGLPDGNGVDFCAEIKKVYPGLKIIMLTGRKEYNYIQSALHNGALGYILKNSDSEELFAGIETVSKGEKFLCEKIDILLKNIKDKNKDRNRNILTRTEKTVLKYIADGYTQKEIAKELECGVETIKSHIWNMRIKLEAKNVAELVKKGYEMGLL